MISAIAFDLDGVLLDSEGSWAEARREVAVSHGGRWPDGVERAMMGMSSPEWAAYLRDELGVRLEPDAIVDAVVHRMLTTYRRRLPLLPGAQAAVRRLSSRWPLGLASSSNRPVIDAALDAAGLRELFTATVSSEEVPRGKPAPDVYLAVAAALDVAPTSCAAVEDSTNGIRAAAAAEMVVIAVPNGQFPPEPEALELVARQIGTLDALTSELVEQVGAGG